MNKFRNIMLVLGLLFGLTFAMAPLNANAIDVFQDCSKAEFKDTAVCRSQGDSAASFLKTLVNSLLFVLGAIAVIVIIIAGITYAMSAGDPAVITRAKNTIIYAIVGLVVAMLAYAIVNFVIKQF